MIMIYHDIPIYPDHPDHDPDDDDDDDQIKSNQIEKGMSTLLDQGTAA